MEVIFVDTNVIIMITGSASPDTPPVSLKRGVLLTQ